MVSEKISASFGTNLWNCKIILVNNLKYFRSAVARSVHLIVFLWEIEYFLEIFPAQKSWFLDEQWKNIPCTIVLLAGNEKVFRCNFE